MFIIFIIIIFFKFKLIWNAKQTQTPPGLTVSAKDIN